MPSVRKLSTAEIAVLEQPVLSARAQAVREYDAYLVDFAAGDYGRVELAEGEQRTLVRTRLQAAARRRGLALRFRLGPNPALIFRVEAAPPPLARPIPTQVAGADQQRTEVIRRSPVSPQPPRRRQTAAERYDKVLPRWMRDGQQGSRRVGSKRRTR